ncbi:MAG: nitroreductase family deazaflavin-dependent oxidoreductase [Pseudomonadales bacterium]
MKKFLFWIAATRFGSWVMKTVFSRVDPIIFRMTGGRFTLAGPVMITYLILTTTGRKSGQQRSVQLVYTDVDGVPHIVASNFGQQHHPAWSHNLMTNPNAIMELEGKTVAVTAVRLSDQEKEAIWETLVANVPNYTVYKSRTDRNLQVYRLEQSVN